MTAGNIFSPTFKHPVQRIHRRTNVGFTDVSEIKRFRRQNNALDVPLRIESMDMDRSILRRAFDLAAEYLRGKDQSLTVIAVGGVTNPIVLPINCTEGPSAAARLSGNTDERQLLDKAVQFARRKSPANLGGEWLSTKTGLCLTQEVQAKIVLEALAQNDVVFSTPGLTVIAAPWKYAFCDKVDRMMRERQHSSDLTDAVTCLQKHIQRHGGRAIAAKVVLKWANEYNLRLSRRALKAVRQEYRRRYRTHAIIGCICSRGAWSCECYTS